MLSPHCPSLRNHWTRRDSNATVLTRRWRRFLEVERLESRITPSISGGELTTNGGFETGDLSGWTLSGNSSDISITGLSHSGNYAAEAGPVGPRGHLSQTLATVAGTQYTFSWWLQSDGGTPNQVQVSWDDQVILNQAHLPSFSYQQYSFTETASGAQTTIQFGFRND